jgi:PTS system fructose-specific IIA component
MMHLSDLLKKETILLSLDAKNREECIDKMVESMVEAGFVTDKSVYMEAVMSREETGTTGIGFGVAIPHGKSKGVAEPGLAFARLTQPIDWKSMDGNPVSVVFLIAVPEEKVGNEHLQILIAISRKLIHEKFRNQLKEAGSAQDIIDILQAI